MRPTCSLLVAFALLCVSDARAEEEANPAETPRAVEADAPRGKLTGRVFERGSPNHLPAARIETEVGAVTAGEDGRFSIEVPAGELKVLVTADGYESLRTTEKINPNEGLSVEYRLLPKGRRRYESTVRGEARREGERFELREEELHALPGSLGDPFRTIAMLPGVATPLPLLPYFVIRGASPGTSGYFIDGMRVPQLFHFLVGGGVVHGRLIDRLDFYPGAYDASFGRYAGGIIDAETRPAREKGQHGEVELRLYDLSTLAEFSLPRGVRVVVGGHYGYPGFLVSAIDARVKELQYGDYQLRIDWRDLTIQALGSYDSVAISADLVGGGVPDTFKQQFHRVQARYRPRVGRVQLETALVGGIDQLSSFGGQGVRKLGLSWRFNLQSRWKRFRLFVGTDGEVSRFTGENFGDSDSPPAPDQLGELAGDRDGVVAGAFANGTVEIVKERFFASAGARLDVYHAGAVTLLGIDPRVNLRANLLPYLHVHAGFGLYQQPPSFPVALPGIDTYALSLGLQQAWQGAAGVKAETPQHFELGITGFYQRYLNVNDVVLDFGPLVCTSPPPESLSGLPALVTRQVDGQSYGMELLVRRTKGVVTGWVAYTLSRSERSYSCGLRPADFDQSHLLNVVVQARLPWKLLLGVRFYLATGRPVTLVGDLQSLSTTRNNVRLPDFVQLDIRLDREWIFKKWALSVFLEVLNLTYSQSNFGLTYPEIDRVRRYDMPQLNGFRWILPSIGVRGRY
jgi:hypothetical protein